ncbi:Hypothetical predicted protein, partial [Pelobates cultripes]
EILFSIYLAPNIFNSAFKFLYCGDVPPMNAAGFINLVDVGLKKKHYIKQS